MQLDNKSDKDLVEHLFQILLRKGDQLLLDKLLSDEGAELRHFDGVSERYFHTQGGIVRTGRKHK